MASSNEFKNFILDQLNELKDITYRKMMGEFIIYYKDIIVGGIYDDRFLIKETIKNKDFMLLEVKPYISAKPMYLVENLEEKEHLKKIILQTYNDLKEKGSR